MILKIKDKKFICRNYVFDIIYNENNRIKGVSLWTKDPNDPKRFSVFALETYGSDDQI